jgi:hypothetical protein
VFTVEIVIPTATAGVDNEDKDCIAIVYGRLPHTFMPKWRNWKNALDLKSSDCKVLSVQIRPSVPLSSRPLSPTSPVES